MAYRRELAKRAYRSERALSEQPINSLRLLIDQSHYVNGRALKDNANCAVATPIRQFVPKHRWCNPSVNTILPASLGVGRARHTVMVSFLQSLEISIAIFWRIWQIFDVVRCKVKPNARLFFLMNCIKVSVIYFNNCQRTYF